MASKAGMEQDSTDQETLFDMEGGSGISKNDSQVWLSVLDSRKNIAVRVHILIVSYSYKQSPHLILTSIKSNF